MSKALSFFTWVERRFGTHAVHLITALLVVATLMIQLGALVGGIVCFLRGDQIGAICFWILDGVLGIRTLNTTSEKMVAMMAYQNEMIDKEVNGILQGRRRL